MFSKSQLCLISKTFSHLVSVLFLSPCNSLLKSSDLQPVLRLRRLKRTKKLLESELYGGKIARLKERTDQVCNRRAE